MRRVMSLALLASAFTTGASASTVTFSTTPTRFLSDLNSLLTTSTPTWQISVRGSVTGLLTIRTLGVTALTSGCMS